MARDAFVTRFNIALEESSLKPVDLARLSEISESTISQYRSGYSKPKRDRIEILARLLNVNPMWLDGYDVQKERLTPDERSINDDIYKEYLIHHYEFDHDDIALIDNYRCLNDEGQRKLEDYLQDLLENPKYLIPGVEPYGERMPR